MVDRIERGELGWDMLGLDLVWSDIWGCCGVVRIWGVGRGLESRREKPGRW